MIGLRGMTIALGLALCFLFGPAHGSHAAEPKRIDVIELRGATVTDALRILAEQYHFNAVASDKAADIEISLFLRDVTPMQVLDNIARVHDLWFKRDPTSGVIRVFTVQEFRLGQVDFKREKTEIFTLRHADPLDIASAIRDLYAERVRLGLGANGNQLRRDLEQRFSRFDLLDERSQDIGGLDGSTSRTDNRLDRLDSTRSRSELRDQGRSGSARASAPSPSKRLTDTKKLTTEPGVKGLLAGEAGRGQTVVNELVRTVTPIYVSVLRGQSRLLVRTRDPEAMRDIHDLVAHLDISASLLLLEVKVLSVDLDDSLESVVDFDFSPGNIIGGFSPSASSNTNFSFQYVSNAFSARLRVLESEGRITEIATPMLLTANHEVSRLFIGEERPINRTFKPSQTIVSNGGTVINPGESDIEFRPIGTTLLLTPSINADRTVNIRLLMETSDISLNAAEILVPDSTGFTKQSVDVVTARSYSGTVVAKDGMAVVIGGLIEESKSNEQSKVPILGDIPLLGMLFRKENKGVSRRELIILVRPYVMMTPSEAEGITREWLKQSSLQADKLESGAMVDSYESQPGEELDYRLKDRFHLHPLY